jgi:hypothetical protein
MYSLNLQQLPILDLDWDIDPIMVRNPIWICQMLKLLIFHLLGKMQGSKNVYFIVLGPSASMLHPLGHKHCINGNAI